MSTASAKVARSDGEHGGIGGLGEHGGIRVTGLARAFGPVKALDGLDLEAAPGEVTALVGPNGSGKTTLLLVLATLLAPDAGAARVDGRDPVQEPRAVRRLIGWMPDGFGTWDTLSVVEVLRTVAAAYGLRSDAANARVDELLALVHLDTLADQPARVLSRGQRQRLGLARALVHDPQVLLLDEPASGLDPRSRVELRDVLRSEAARGKTVLVSSHILTELDEMADRAVIVAAGRRVATHEMSTRAAGTRWRVRAAGGRTAELDAGLRAIGGAARPVGLRPEEGYLVEVGDEVGAAALLAELVRRDIQVCEFAPERGGGLEEAYLDATAGSEDRR